MRIVGLFLCGLIVLTQTEPSRVRHELFIATQGSDSNSGAIDKPFRTLQHAAEIALPGDTVIVMGGVYCQRLRITASGNRAGGFITFRNASGEKAILDGGCLKLPEGDTSMVEVVDASYIRIEGLEIRNFESDNPDVVPWGIRIVGSGSHIEILNNNVHHIEQNAPGWSGGGANALGIGVYGTNAKSPISELVIDGNELHHLKTGLSESLAINGNVSEFRITRNRVHDNNNIGIDMIGFEGVAPDPKVDRARNGLVSGNLVYNITGGAGHGNADADGIYVDGGTRIIIEQNIVHDVDYGISLESEHFGRSTSHVIARNNLVYSCHSAGMDIGGYDLKRGSSEEVTMVNNTLYQNNTWGKDYGEFLMMFRMKNNAFKNNVVVPGPGRKVFGSLYHREGNESTVAIDHNLFFVSSGPSAPIWKFDGVEYTTFAEYVSRTGNDKNSLLGDADFTDPTAHNFHLQSKSPGRGAGIDLGAEIRGIRDLDGRSRTNGQRIDVGCYQSGR